jgi:hypothetical protein
MTPDEALDRAFSAAKKALADEPSCVSATPEGQMVMLQKYLVHTGGNLEHAASAVSVYRDEMEKGTRRARQMAQEIAFDRLTIAIASGLLTLAHFPGLENLDVPDEPREYVL